MPLTRVTITGADDTTDIADLINLHKEYPFVEFGILVSVARIGQPRYPSNRWQNFFRDQAFDLDLNVSMHVCGHWSREFFRALPGADVWRALPPIKSCVRRMQINGNTNECSDYLPRVLRQITERERCREFIFQWPGGAPAMREAFNANLGAFALFDESGGRGGQPNKWDAPVSGRTISCAGKRFVGYAGGLCPENVSENLDAIEAVCPDDFWIDAEGRLRDADNRLDIKRARAFLRECSKRVRMVNGTPKGL